MRDYESKENVHPDWEEVYHRYVEMVYRTCVYFLKHPADAEDAVQTVFLRFLEKAPPFQEEGHCKAWLLVTASNVCRDVLRRKMPGRPFGAGRKLLPERKRKSWKFY